jgi:CRISPR/Cas system-associated exonuclease Cas4 (RecB family)
VSPETDDKPKGRYFSVSSVEEFLECPQRYFLGRVQRKPRPPRNVPVPWRLGTVVHAGFEGAYRAAREQHRPGTMINYRAEAEEALRKSWAEEELGDTYGDLDWCLEVLFSSLEALGVPHPSQIALVEEQMVQVSDDGVIMHGYVDLGLLLSPTEFRIRDWKVTSRTNGTGEIARSPQLLLYAWLVRRLYPEVERVYVEEYYPPLRKAVTVESDRENELEVVERVEMVAEMVEEASASGDWPTKVGEHCDTCPMRSYCPAWTTDGVTEAQHGVRKF